MGITKDLFLRSSPGVCESAMCEREIGVCVFFGGLFSRRSVGSRASLPLLVSYSVMTYRNDDCWRPIEGPVPAVSLNSLGGNRVLAWLVWECSDSMVSVA
jgi:hypothetical protein